MESVEEAKWMSGCLYGRTIYGATSDVDGQLET